MTLKGRCFLNSCILANNIETVTDFISLIFDETSAEILINPVKHAIIKLDENSQLLLIQKSTCSKQQLKFLLATSVTHVTSYSKNVMGIQRNAIVAGAKIITKCTDDNPAYCVIQGPENIVFIVSLHENSEQKSWFYDYILENLPALGTGISSPIPNFVAASRKGLGLIRLGSTRNPEVRARSLSPAAVRSSGDKNNKTIAQSVKLQLTDANALKPGDAKNKGSDKTNTSILNVLNSSSVTAINGDTTGSNSNPPNLASLPIFGPPLTTVESAVYLTGHDHVVFPPNSQDPIAFETDFFKGQMMLVVRTEPIIPEFKQFFAGKR